MNILFIIKTPPPITGATIINQFVTQIKYDYFNCKFIKISYKKTLKRNFIFISFIKTISVLFKLVFSIISFRPRFSYFQISPIGLAFYRDCLYVFILKLFRVKIIYHLHGKGIYKVSNIRLIKSIYKWTFKKSYVICLSEKLSEDIKEVYTGKIYIVNNGIPVYHQVIFPANKIDKKFNLLFLSHLQKSKGILIFLETLRLLLDNEKYKSIVNAKIIGSELDVTINHLFSEILRFNINENIDF
jgi:glycosyltransferase involved in cell wall biosynthesis